MTKMSLYVKETFVNAPWRDRAFLQVRREQGGPGTVTVLDARGEHDDRDEQAQGSVTMNRFLPLIFLPAS